MRKAFLNWQMNRKIARWEKITVMLGHGVLATQFHKLAEEQKLLAAQIRCLERSLGIDLFYA